MASLTLPSASWARVLLGIVLPLVFFSGCSNEGPADTCPPAQIFDLAVSGHSTCSLDLTWTATGDDGLAGKASGYDLRYSTSTITEATWADAAQCQGEPSPVDVGGEEHFTVAGLAAGTQYYFRVAATDREGNASPLSNVAISETDSGGVSPGVAWVRDGLGPEDQDWTNATSDLSATWAVVSGATGYEYAIGATRGATDVVTWRPPSGADQTTVTHAGLDLAEGATYYFSVRALLDGGCSGHGTSDGIAADRTGPDSRVRALPGEVYGLGVRITWTGGDDLSGIAEYDVQSRDGEAGAWTDWKAATADTTAVLEGQDGHTYFFRSRARDRARNQEEYPGTADAQTVLEYALPSVAWVRDGLGPEDADFTGSTSELAATWAAVEGAEGYEYGIGTGPQSPDVVDWTSAGTETSVTRGGLGLGGCRKYFFLVRVCKGPGFSAAVSSDGVTVDIQPPASRVYALPDTMRVAGGSMRVGWILLYWVGLDRQSGIDHYDVQYRPGSGGQWHDATVGTTGTSTWVMVSVGLVQFRCRAVDKAGNVEPYPSSPDAWTYIARGNDGPQPPPPPPPSPYALKLALHLAAHGISSCKSLPAINSRADLVRSWPAPGTDLDVFLIVFAYDSLSSFVYGLDWPAEWGSASTRACADVFAGDIQRPGDGLSLGWNSCRVRGEAPSFYPVAWTWLTPSTNGSIWITYDPLWGPDDGLGGADCREDRYQTFHYPDSTFCAAVGLDPYEGLWCGASAMGCIRALFK